MIRGIHVKRFQEETDLDMYTRPALSGSVYGGWVILSARFLVMHRLVTWGHRFFRRTFAIPVVLPRSLGHQKRVSTREHVHSAIAELFVLHESPQFVQ